MSGGDDWLDEFDPEAWEAEEAYEAEISAAPPAPPRGGRAAVEVICCPEESCGSHRVELVRRRADRGFSEWSCRECRVEWREDPDAGRERGYLA